MQCFSSHTVGCSPSEAHDVGTYIDVLVPLYKLVSACYKHDLSTELYQSCQAPPTCSLKKAAECHVPLMNKVTCRYVIIGSNSFFCLKEKRSTVLLNLKNYVGEVYYLITVIMNGSFRMFVILVIGVVIIFL